MISSTIGVAVISGVGVTVVVGVVETVITGVIVMTGVVVIVPVAVGVPVATTVEEFVAVGVGVGWLADVGRTSVMTTATKTLTATLPAAAIQIIILTRILVLIIRASLTKVDEYFHLYIQLVLKSTT